MKKLLSILGSIAIVASSASAVVACSQDNTKLNVNDNKPLTATTQESLNDVKPLVMADQYGLALNKTQDTISRINGYPNEYSNFSQINSSVVKGLNTNGLIGKDNLPLYELQNQLNQFLGGVLGKLGIGSIDLTPYFDNWGGIIKEIPTFINAGNIDGLISLIPVILNNVVGLIPAGLIGPKTIEKVTKWIKDNIQTLIEQFNFNYRIGDIIRKNGGKATLAQVTDAGSKALLDLGNMLFSSYEKTNGFNSSDNAASAFIGTEILTPLLNNKSIDKNKISQVFNLDKILSHIGDIVNDTATVLATIFMRITVYLPLMNKTPGKDNIDNLFTDAAGKSNDKAFSTYDQKILTVDDSTDTIKYDGADKPISFNNIFDVLNLIADTNQDDLGIFKLTSILFHNSGDSKAQLNPFVSALTKILVDALKFTDYEVKLSASQDIKVGTIKINMDFKLSDLFIAGKEINIVDPVPGIVNQALWFGSRNLSIVMQTSGNGINDNSKYIANLLEAILVGRKLDSDSLNNYVKDIMGKNGDGLIVAEKAQTYDNVGFLKFKWQWHTSALSQADTAWGILWAILGGKISPILNGILNTMWYTDGTDFFKALVSSGFVKQEAADSLKTKLQPYLPLSKFVLNWLQNSPIGDITKIAGKTNGMLNIDAILNALKYLFMTNVIQDKTNAKQAFDKGTDNSGASLIQQLLNSIPTKEETNTPEKKAAAAKKQADEWNYYLGFEGERDKTSDTSKDPKSRYVKKDSFIGQLIEVMYPQLDATQGVITSDNWINIRALSVVHSDLMDALSAYMNKLGGELEGKDLTYVVKPLLDNSSVWKVRDIKDKYFNGTDDLQSESYILTFDSGSVQILDGTKPLSRMNGKYRITFSKIDSQSTFDFNGIEKIS